MRVPALDLAAQHAPIREELLEAVTRVIDSQRFILGPEVQALESRVAEYCSCEMAIGVSSGTDALLVSLMALGIGKGDEVITTPFTFFATAGSIWRTGARPVFVDIEYDTFNIDPARISEAITKRTKAIIPVHLFGQPADMLPILDLAHGNNLFVVEDAAQAIGASYHGRSVGTLGDVGCFSFFPSKNLGGFGDGGMVTTNNTVLGERIQSLRRHGLFLDNRGGSTIVGGNFRLDTIQAAVLLVKMQHLDAWSRRRRGNAAAYDQRLVGHAGVITPAVRSDRSSVYNQYVIRAEGNQSELRRYFSEREVEVKVYYPVCLHLMGCFRELGYVRGIFPVAEKAAEEVLALPIHPALSAEQIVFVAESIREVCK